MSRFYKRRLVVLCLALSACSRASADDLDRSYFHFPLFGEDKKGTDDHSNEVVPSKPDFSLVDDGKRMKPGHINSIYIVERAEHDRLLVREKAEDPARGRVAVDDVVPLGRADSFFSAAINDNPANAFAYVMRATVRRHLLKLDRALADLDEALRLDPNRRDALIQRALIAASQEKLDLALADIDRAVALDSSDAQAYLTRALLHEHNGDHKNAAVDLNTAMKLGCRSTAAHWAGIMLMIEMHHTKMAREVLTRWLRSRPDQELAYRCYILLALIDANDWKVLSAMSDLSQAIAIDPKEDTAHLLRAAIYAGLALPSSSLDEINTAIRLNPENGGSYRFRAAARVHRREYALALADFETAITKGPNDADAHAGRALLLASCPDAKIRRGNEAVASAKRACELSQWKTARHLAALAAACAEAGDFRAAVTNQQKAIGLLKKYDSTADEYRKTLERYKANKPSYRLGILEEWGLRTAQQSGH
jgi:tetratricopeptide (TPR) repeat protein